MGEFHLSSYKKVLSPSRCEGVSSCVANREVPDKLQVLAERVPRCQERSVSIQRILLTFRRDCEGCPIVLKTSEPIWRYPVFAFICYVSIHLEISATMVRFTPEELPIQIRTTSFRTCGLGQDSVQKLRRELKSGLVAGDDLFKPGLLPNVASLQIVVG